MSLLSLYGKRILRNSMANRIAAASETRYAIVWEVFSDDRYCEVKIQGSDTKIVADFPQTWQITPTYMKPGSAVIIQHTGGIRGRIEIIGQGQYIPTAIAGSSQPIPTTLHRDEVLCGCEVSALPEADWYVTISAGAYRIDDVYYYLGALGGEEGAMQMAGSPTMEMGDAVPMGSLSAWGVAIDRIPSRTFSGGTIINGPFEEGEVITQDTNEATFIFIRVEGNVLYVADASWGIKMRGPSGIFLLTGTSSGATYTPTSTTKLKLFREDLIIAGDDSEVHCEKGDEFTAIQGYTETTLPADHVLLARILVWSTCTAVTQDLIHKIYSAPIPYGVEVLFYYDELDWGEETGCDERGYPFCLSHDGLDPHINYCDVDVILKSQYGMEYDLAQAYFTLDIHPMPHDPDIIGNIRKWELFFPPNVPVWANGSAKFCYYRKCGDWGSCPWCRENCPDPGTPPTLIAGEPHYLKAMVQVATSPTTTLYGKWQDVSGLEQWYPPEE